MKVLLTGGAGYIGSHIAVELLNHGHDIAIVDNLSNSSEKTIQNIEQITQKTAAFYKTDLRDAVALDNIFTQEQPDAIIHLAGLKAVGESTKDPLSYYDNNVGGSLRLLQTMRTHGVKKLVFSSSATVYGDAQFPYEESAQAGVGITNPYGNTKYTIEQLLKDVAVSDTSAEFTSLRYFNPVGAHESGLLGENPKGIPDNLMPLIAQVADGQRSELIIFGNDYPTRDGTCVRDFVHVVDVARGHIAALEHLSPGFDVINLGSGYGTSVMELIHAFEQASGRPIPYTIGERRSGDLPEYYAAVTKANEQLGWHAERTIQQMCEDAWRWQSTTKKFS